jgi:riboflavin kinase/FMN adenylyltransferase
MTFEPHPRDYFANVYKQPDLAPARIATLRDKLERVWPLCGVQQCIVLPFNEKFAGAVARTTSSTMF